MKQRHRVRTALGASAALAVGAGIALASVPAAQPASKPASPQPVSATYSTASAELVRLRSQLSGSAHDTALLQSVITRLQREVDAAQAGLEQVRRVGRQAARSPDGAPAKAGSPEHTVVPARSHHSPSSPAPTRSDDHGGGDD